MRVLHIGPLSSQHTQIAALTYRSLGYDAVFLNTRRGFCPPSVPGVPDANVIVNPWPEPERGGRRIGRSLYRSVVLAIRYLDRPDASLSHALHRLAHQYAFDVVVGTWGVPVLEAMLCAQDVLRDSAFIHNVLTYPDLPVSARGLRGSVWRAYMRVFDRIQQRAYKAMLANCDVRVHCSANMLSYLKEHVGLSGPGEDLIRVERFNRCFFPRRRLAKLSSTDNQPHVIHIGATNFTGDVIDNLADTFGRMARAGIHVHFSGRSLPQSFSHEEQQFLHPFPALPMVPISGALAEFMTRYDAAVIAFNVSGPYDRFTNALPTRFLFSLVAGIPIVVPKAHFDACKQYILEHQIGFAYEDEEHLAETLKDSRRAAEWQENALAHSARASVEDALSSFESLMTRAMAIRGARSRLTSRAA